MNSTFLTTSLRSLLVFLLVAAGSVEARAQDAVESFVLPFDELSQQGPGSRSMILSLPKAVPLGGVFWVVCDGLRAGVEPTAGEPSPGQASPLTIHGVELLSGSATVVGQRPVPDIFSFLQPGQSRGIATRTFINSNQIADAIRLTIQVGNSAERTHRGWLRPNPEIGHLRLHILRGNPSNAGSRMRLVELPVIPTEFVGPGEGDWQTYFFANHQGDEFEPIPGQGLAYFANGFSVPKLVRIGDARRGAHPRRQHDRPSGRHVRTRAWRDGQRQLDREQYPPLRRCGA